MSQENVEVVRRGYEAWAEGGIEAAVADFLDPDVELHDIVEMPGGSVHRGHDGARAMWAQWTEVWEEMRFALEQAVDLGGEHVLVQVRAVGRAREADTPIEVSFYEVWTVRNGRGIKRVASTDRASALEAAGLRASSAGG